MNPSRLNALMVVCLLLCAGIAQADDFPRTISYQGRVTDAADNPITNPAGSFQFRLYNDPVAGVMVWSESAVLAVEDGLFAHDLGSSCGLCAIPDSVFFDDDSLWLEVQYDAEVMTPRTMLTASPYAYRVASVDKSTGGTITGEVVVTGSSIGNQFSVTNTGLGRGGFFQNANASNGEAAIQGTHVGSGAGGSFFSEFGPGLTALSNIGDAAEMNGSVDINGDFRNLQVRNNSDQMRAELGLGADGAELILRSPGGSDAIVMTGGLFGNDAAALPNGAISALEMHNEPGLANTRKPGQTSFGVSLTTVTSRSITAVSSGYIIAIATGTINWTHTNGSIDNFDIYVTDVEGSVGGKPNNRYLWSGNVPTGSFEAPFSITGVFQVGVGAHTFYVQAISSFSGSYSTNNTELVLLFVPTAYGGVVSASPPADSDDPALMGVDQIDTPQRAEQIEKQRLEREVKQLREQVDAIMARLNKTED